jgi:kynurenine 3-monooxygenase
MGRLIAVVGAGPAGLLMAIHLALRDFHVEVYERLGDMRKESVERGRSINITLSARGIGALKEVGVLDAVMRTAVPVKGRMVHAINGALMLQRYGKDEHEVLHAVRRKDLNAALLDFANELPNLTLSFNRRCIGLDKNRGETKLQDVRTGETINVQPDLVIGADGLFSTVRQHMQRGERADYQQEYLDWGYKELTIPAGSDGSFLLEKNALHIWPRGDSMLLAVPNFDGSFTCTLVLPFEGDPSFSSLRTKADASAFFGSQYCDVMPLSLSLFDDLAHNPIGDFATITTSPWYYKNRIVLLGDACHAVFPFYGQGLNAALEDCSVLIACMEQHSGDWEAAFEAYEIARKRNTDVLAELSKQNFVELRDKAKSNLLIARKNVSMVLHQTIPRIWVPLYTMIAHTAIPYADALERSRKQDRIAKWLGMDVAVIAVVIALFVPRLIASISECFLAFMRRLGKLVTILGSRDASIDERASTDLEAVRRL